LALIQWFQDLDCDDTDGAALAARNLCLSCRRDGLGAGERQG
jgi:hypothetical protein